jgi:hydrogenase nickel incorporation protein HypB
MVISITEGEDKPLKYPLMFHACDAVLINKLDLLDHLDFDLDLLTANITAVNPRAEQFRLSGRTGEGVWQWRDWLRRLLDRNRATAR